MIYNKNTINHQYKELSLINDSKKLTHKKRCSALEVIEKFADNVYCAMVSHRIVDRLNVNGATFYALSALVEKMPVKPDIIIMDGNFKFNLRIPLLSIIKGDSKSISIASASIAAKVKRDAILNKFDLLYPGYGLSRNKGYGTLEHRNSIIASGPSHIHRRSFEPVKSMSMKSGLFDNEDK